MASPPEAKRLKTEEREEEEDDLAPVIPVETATPRDALWKVHDDACIYRRAAAAAAAAANNNNDKPRTAAAAFDLGETLLVARCAGWPSRLEHYELYSSHVVTKMRELYDGGEHNLIVFCNQGGIRGAMQGKKATFVKNLIDWLAVHVLERPLSCVISTKKQSGYHKPSAKMWMVAEKYCNGGQAFDISKSLYVGDAVGDTETPDEVGVDIGFAQNVGTAKGSTLKFYTPEQFFGPSDKENRSLAQGLENFEEPPPAALQARAALASGYLLSDRPVLLTLCGVQGSGKSTFCQHLLQGDYDNEEDSEHWVHLSQDTINNGKPGKREKVEEEAKKALRMQKSVIIDRMHLDDSQRKYFVDVAKDADVPAHAVVLSATKDTIAKRVRERENHQVQGEQGAKLAVSNIGKLVMPKYSEGFELISATRTVEGARKIVDLYRRGSSPALQNSAKIAQSFLLDDDEDISLPSIALGTQKIGRKLAEGIVATAVKHGFKAVDTAPTYNNEDKIGGSLKGDDRNIFCIVKVPKKAIRPEDVRTELSKSLSNLQRPRADLLLLHWPSDVMASGTMKEVWQEMEKCKAEGLALSLGVCNFNVGALRTLLSHCSIRPSVNQVERHPLLPQWDLVDFCAQHDILLQAHTPLGQGNAQLLEHAVIQKVATSTGKSAAQVVLQWNLQQGVAVVPKCSSEPHMRECLSILQNNDSCSGGSSNNSSKDVLLSVEHMREFNELGGTTTKRFVAPPFMYGSEVYCFGKKK